MPHRLAQASPASDDAIPPSAPAASRRGHHSRAHSQQVHAASIGTHVRSNTGSGNMMAASASRAAIAAADASVTPVASSSAGVASAFPRPGHESPSLLSMMQLPELPASGIVAEPLDLPSFASLFPPEEAEARRLKSAQLHRQHQRSFSGAASFAAQHGSAIMPHLHQSQRRGAHSRAASTSDAGHMRTISDLAANILYSRETDDLGSPRVHATGVHASAVQLRTVHNDASSPLHLWRSTVSPPPEQPPPMQPQHHLRHERRSMSGVNADALQLPLPPSPSNSSASSAVSVDPIGVSSTPMSPEPAHASYAHQQFSFPATPAAPDGGEGAASAATSPRSSTSTSKPRFGFSSVVEDVLRTQGASLSTAAHSHGVGLPLLDTSATVTSAGLLSPVPLVTTSLFDGVPTPLLHRRIVSGVEPPHMPLESHDEGNESVTNAEAEIEIENSGKLAALRQEQRRQQREIADEARAASVAHAAASAAPAVSSPPAPVPAAAVPLISPPARSIEDHDDSGDDLVDEDVEEAEEEEEEEEEEEAEADLMPSLSADRRTILHWPPHVPPFTRYAGQPLPAHLVSLLRTKPSRRSPVEICMLACWLGQATLTGHFLSGCSPTGLMQLAQRVGYEKVSISSFLMREGQESDRVFLLLSGTVSVWERSGAAAALAAMNIHNQNQAVRNKEQQGTILAVGRKQRNLSVTSSVESGSNASAASSSTAAAPSTLISSSSSLSSQSPHDIPLDLVRDTMFLIRGSEALGKQMRFLNLISVHANSGGGGGIGAAGSGAGGGAGHGSTSGAATGSKVLDPAYLAQVVGDLGFAHQFVDLSSPALTKNAGAADSYADLLSSATVAPPCIPSSNLASSPFPTCPVLGLQGVLSNTRRSASVVTEELCELLTLPKFLLENVGLVAQHQTQLARKIALVRNKFRLLREPEASTAGGDRNLLRLMYYFRFLSMARSNAGGSSSRGGVVAPEVSGKGGCIIAQGERLKYVYFILEGQVEIRARANTGADSSVATGKAKGLAAYGMTHDSSASTGGNKKGSTVAGLNASSATAASEAQAPSIPLYTLGPGETFNEESLFLPASAFSVSTASGVLNGAGANHQHPCNPYSAYARSATVLLLSIKPPLLRQFLRSGALDELKALAKLKNAARQERAQIVQGARRKQQAAETQQVHMHSLLAAKAIGDVLHGGDASSSVGGVSTSVLLLNAASPSSNSADSTASSLAIHPLLPSRSRKFLAKSALSSVPTKPVPTMGGNEDERKEESDSGATASSAAQQGEVEVFRKDGVSGRSHVMSSERSRSAAVLASAATGGSSSAPPLAGIIPSLLLPLVSPPSSSAAAAHSHSMRSSRSHAGLSPQQQPPLSARGMMTSTAEELASRDILSANTARAITGGICSGGSGGGEHHEEHTAGPATSPSHPLLHPTPMLSGTIPAASPLLALPFEVTGARPLPESHFAGAPAMKLTATERRQEYQNRTHDSERDSAAGFARRSSTGRHGASDAPKSFSSVGASFQPRAASPNKRAGRPAGKRVAGSPSRAARSAAASSAARQDHHHASSSSVHDIVHDEEKERMIALQHTELLAKKTAWNDQRKRWGRNLLLQAEGGVGDHSNAGGGRHGSSQQQLQAATQGPLLASLTPQAVFQNPFLLTTQLLAQQHQHDAAAAAAPLHGTSHGSVASSSSSSSSSALTPHRSLLLFPSSHDYQNIVQTNHLTRSLVRTMTKVAVDAMLEQDQHSAGGNIFAASMPSASSTSASHRSLIPAPILSLLEETLSTDLELEELKDLQAESALLDRPGGTRGGIGSDATDKDFFLPPLSPTSKLNSWRKINNGTQQLDSPATAQVTSTAGLLRKLHLASQQHVLSPRKKKKLVVAAEHKHSDTSEDAQTVPAITIHAPDPMHSSDGLPMQQESGGSSTALSATSHALLHPSASASSSQYDASLSVSPSLSSLVDRLHAHVHSTDAAKSTALQQHGQEEWNTTAGTHATHVELAKRLQRMKQQRQIADHSSSAAVLSPGVPAAATASTAELPALLLPSALAPQRSQRMLREPSATAFLPVSPSNDASASSLPSRSAILSPSESHRALLGASSSSAVLGALHAPRMPHWDHMTFAGSSNAAPVSATESAKAATAPAATARSWRVVPLASSRDIGNAFRAAQQREQAQQNRAALMQGSQTARAPAKPAPLVLGSRGMTHGPGQKHVRKKSDSEVARRFFRLGFPGQRAAC